ncbi:uncharacterized protein LOC144575561 isoform X1 [Carex rostrata]
MGGSYLGNTVNCEDTSLNSIPGNCSCEVPGADDDLCVHYFEELDFSSFDISGAEEIDDGLELDELVTDLSQELIFHDVDENENIFDGNGSDDSESLSNDPDSTEGLTSDGVSPSLEGEKLTDTAENKSEDVLTKSSISNNSEPRRVVSAIKGSRVKEGIKVESVLRVRWAPDVYDPPVTSDDHTLKKVAYKPRAKPVRKEYYSHKNKHSKSKTLHQGRSRSQHTSKSSSQKTVDQRMLRLQGRQGKAPMDSLALQKVPHINANDKATTSETKELKFGSSFCREPVTSTVHIPLAEAT